MMSIRRVKVNSDSLMFADDAVTQGVAEEMVGMGKSEQSSCLSD